MSESPQDHSPGITDELQIAYLREVHPIPLLENLPAPVFPVKLTIECPPTRNSDSSHPEYSAPEYPVNTAIPQTPYIPRSTVYFDNPASRPPAGSQVWKPKEFISALSAQLNAITDDRRQTELPTRVLSATFVEIPYVYLTTDQQTGQPVAKPDLFNNEAEFSLIEFAPDGGVSAAHIQDEIDGLAGESVSPRRLRQLVVATAKPTRHEQGTQHRPSRTRYYTETEADNTGELSRTPAVYAVDDVAGETRPLSPIIKNLDNCLPQLAQADDIVASATLAGETREKKTFIAEEIIN